MRIGILGVGGIGSAHAEVLVRHGDVDGLVVNDANRERAKAVAQQLSCESTDSVEEVLDSGIDALVIATATDSHAGLIVAGSWAGTPVFCAKPIALNVDDSRRVVQQVVDAAVEVQVGFQRRFDYGYHAAREALRSGRIGGLHRVHMVTADPAPPPPSYIPTSGGMYRDCHIHDFDILRWVTGQEVVDVTAFAANRGADVFREAEDVDNGGVLLRLGDDTLVTLQGSLYDGAGYDVRMELAGTSATLAVGLDSRTPLTSAEDGVTFPEGDPWPDFWDRFTPAYVAEMNALVEVVKGERSSPCTVEDGPAALYVAEAAELSLREGRRVRVSEIAA